jgi:hypothetical protein
VRGVRKGECKEKFEIGWKIMENTLGGKLLEGAKSETLA